MGVSYCFLRYPAWYSYRYMDTNSQNGVGVGNPYFIPVAIVLAGLFIGGAVIWNNNNPVMPGGGDGAPTVPVDIADVKTDGSPFIGDPNAPVTIAYWSDYQCPFCKRFDQETMPILIEKYVNTGKVKIVFKDFQFLGPDSMTGALYGRAVWEVAPSAYKAFHAAMAAAQDEEHGGFGDAASIDELLKTIPGVDAAAVTAAVKANESRYKGLIESDRAEGARFNINSTPSFIIGKQVIAGAQPAAVFEAAIEAVLN